MPPIYPGFGPPIEPSADRSLEQLKGAILHELRSSGPLGLSTEEIADRLGSGHRLGGAFEHLIHEGRATWSGGRDPRLCLTACQRALDDAEVRSAVADKERAACWDALASSRVAPMAELAPTLADAIIAHVNAANQERAQRQTLARGLDLARVTEERDRARQALETMAAKNAAIQPEWSAQHVLFEARKAAGIDQGVSIIEWCREKNAPISKAIAEMHEHFGRELPCGHKVRDLISAPNTVTKCGACILEQKARRESAGGEDPAFVREAAAHPTMKGLAGGGIRGSG